MTKDLTLDGISNYFQQTNHAREDYSKKEISSTIYNLILLKRISLAKHLLAEGKNISETYSLYGFNDYSNFIRMFKQGTAIHLLSIINSMLKMSQSNPTPTHSLLIKYQTFSYISLAFSASIYLPNQLFQLQKSITLHPSGTVILGVLSLYSILIAP